MTEIFAATLDAGSYKVLFVVHILAVIAAFGPLMVSAPLNRLAISKTGDDARTVAEIPLRTAKTISMPPFIVAVLAGIGMVADSKIGTHRLFSFDQQWISLAFSLVLAIGLVYYFLLLPAQRRLIEAVQTGTAEEHATSPEIRSAKATSAAATGVIHLCMLVLVIDMVWKPGL
jgi:hypothetical protein